MATDVAALEPEPIARNQMRAAYLPIRVDSFGSSLGPQLISWVTRATRAGINAARREPFDIVYSTNNNLFNLSASLCVAGRLSLPCLVVVHHLRWVNYLNESDKTPDGRLDPRLFFKSLLREKLSLIESTVRVAGGCAEAFLLAKCDGIIAISKTVALQAQSIVGKSPVWVVENAPFPHDAGRFGPVPREESALFIGRLDEGKGLLELLSAWERVVSRNPRATLEIAGEGLLRRRLEKEVERLHLSPHIRFRGFLADEAISELQRKCRLFITLSRTEGFGMAMVEALASGLPVVAWDIPPFHEIFSECPAVSLERPGDLDSIVQASNRILNMSNEDWSDLSKSARRFAGRFSWADAARSELKAFKKVAEGFRRDR